MIKNCPFCGSDSCLADEAACNFWPEETRDENKYYVVLCGGCGTEGPKSDTPEQAIAAWNTMKKEPLKPKQEEE